MSKNVKAALNSMPDPAGVAIMGKTGTEAWFGHTPKGDGGGGAASGELVSAATPEETAAQKSAADRTAADAVQKLRVENQLLSRADAAGATRSASQSDVLQEPSLNAPARSRGAARKQLLGA